MKLLIILLSFFTSSAHAQLDVTLEIISGSYEAGSYLLYDCHKKHWVCVPEASFKECWDLRESEMRAGIVNLSCAPVSELPTRRSCLQRQLFMTSNAVSNRFCISDFWKQKEIEFSSIQ